MVEPLHKSGPGNGGSTKAASADMEKELSQIKDDVSQLTQSVSNLLSAGGSQAMKQARYQATRAKRKFDGAVSEAGDMASEATNAVREVRDDLAEAIEESVYKRPFTTLGMTLALGFVVGALWRK
jgi:ElaB/YqjD/DUF883 family membrane-anchored ribosome-binding protein